ncbi:MAG TPA: flagellar motor protein MotB [Candidatus Hydrogenedentes bacterium]|nr:flagellar motor protein MotB [Candidatus Hydrogenedentota bacterium]HPG67904.1 flagellar motor protein MotB [Candidatus Hydrogenedentota bacterium]
MARPRRKEEAPSGAPAWMVTYGDMMGLLLCFFVLLLSFSTVSEEAFNQALASLKGALGVLDLNDSLINPLPRRPTQSAEDIEEMARELQREMQVRAKDQDVKIEFDEDGGLKITLPSSILFDVGGAVLRPEAAVVLDEVGEVLRDVPDAFIEVRGHTDGLALTRRSDQFRDNYDLSYRRADAVTRRLNETARIPLEQFEIVACGPGQPVATNDTPEGRQANRRVEIHVRGAFNRGKIDELRERAARLNEQTEEKAVTLGP